jgi:hypothetical protein
VLQHARTGRPAAGPALARLPAAVGEPRRLRRRRPAGRVPRAEISRLRRGAAGPPRPLRGAPPARRRLHRPRRTLYTLSVLAVCLRAPLGLRPLLMPMPCRAAPGRRRGRRAVCASRGGNTRAAAAAPRAPLSALPFRLPCVLADPLSSSPIRLSLAGAASHLDVSSGRALSSLSARSLLATRASARPASAARPLLLRPARIRLLASHLRRERSTLFLSLSLLSAFTEPVAHALVLAPAYPPVFRASLARVASAVLLDTAAPPHTLSSQLPPPRTPALT